MLPTQFRHIRFTSHKICISPLRLRNNPVNKATNIPMMFTAWLWTIKTRHRQRFLERFFFFLNVFIRAFIFIPIRLWKIRAKKKEEKKKTEDSFTIPATRESKTWKWEQSGAGSFYSCSNRVNKNTFNPIPSVSFDNDICKLWRARSNYMRWVSPARLLILR